MAKTFRNLALHEISAWALTGGVAIELHILKHGGELILRPLHDLDFITGSFDFIPGTLGRRLLLRHVHPHDPPGKNMLQGVDPDTQVRLDVFRAYGLETERASLTDVAGTVVKIVSMEDLVARHARLNWDLMEGKHVAPKYARDFLRLIDLVAIDKVESIWQEHRKPQSLESFAETASLLSGIIASRPELLISPAYSTDIHEVCPRCHGSETFQLADASQILSILGYC